MNSLRGIILFFINLLSYSCDSAISFGNKSIFFSSLEDAMSKSNDLKFEYMWEQPHKTDMVIAKLEVDEKVSQLNYKNTMSIQIGSYFYRNLICIDVRDSSNFYSLKSKILRNINTMHYKNSDSHSEISDENNLCYERMEYIDKNLHLEEKNSQLASNFFFNLVNLNENINTNTNTNTNTNIRLTPPAIERLLNVSIQDIHAHILQLFADLIKWNEYCHYELLFVYDPDKAVFVMHKVFFYFHHIPKTKSDNSMENTDDRNFYFSLIKVGKSYFDHVFMLQKSTQKLVKYSKNYKNTNREKISRKDFMTDNDGKQYIFHFKPRIQTSKKDSLFHNTITIKLNENLIDNFYKKYKFSFGTDMCFLIHQLLTEDTYIEKNQFVNFIEGSLKVSKDKYRFTASRYIDQELSSDLSEQYFFSLLFCHNKENFKSLNYQITYPVHLRYQPSLKSTAASAFQTVMMPHPYLEILPSNNTLIPDFSQILFDEYLNDYNIIDKDDYFYKVKKKTSGELTEQYDERKIFYHEIQLKMKTIVNDFYMFMSNYDELRHYVPAGQMKHFWIVGFVTILATGLGFLFILYGLVRYAIAKSFESSEENENRSGSGNEQVYKVEENKLLKED